MKTEQTVSRRGVIKAAGAAGGILILPSHVLGRGGKTSPNDKMNIAFIGLGTYGARGLKELSAHNAVALCDVDWRPRSVIGGNQVVASEVAANYPNVKRFDDWRVMLHEMDKQIDGVLVCSADHTHAIATITAMKMGKHVFCEKPLAHSIGEVRAMMAAQHKYKVATQTGIQGHASEDCRMMVEWIRDGAIGDVREVHLFQKPHPGTGPKYYDRLQHVSDQVAIPAEVKWDLWLGPAAERPYNPMYLPRRWRDFVDFGTGILGDHGPHYMDVVYWALDLGFPETIEAETDPEYDPRQMWPRMSAVQYGFPARGKHPPVKLTWFGFREPPTPQGWPAGKPLPDGGGIFIGSKGTIAYGPLYMSRPGAPLEGQVTLLPEELDKHYKRPDRTIPRPQSHWLEWVDASRSGKQPGADFQFGGMVTQLCLLGDIAMRNRGNILRFDRKKGKFTNSEAANRMFETPSREGWKLPS